MTGRPTWTAPAHYHQLPPQQFLLLKRPMFHSQPTFPSQPMIIILMKQPMFHSQHIFPSQPIIITQLTLQTQPKQRWKTVYKQISSPVTTLTGLTGDQVGQEIVCWTINEKRNKLKLSKLFRTTADCIYKRILFMLYHYFLECSILPNLLQLLYIYCVVTGQGISLVRNKIMLIFI